MAIRRAIPLSAVVTAAPGATGVAILAEREANDRE